MKKIYIILVLLLCMCSPAISATYYVDYVGGADTNNGTTTDTPFKHSPGDAACTNTCASTTLAAGDTVIFKGGVTYTGSGDNLITIGSSGSAGNYITYDGNSAGTWGTGKAVIDLNHTSYHAFYASSKNYIKILNFDIKKAKNNATSASFAAGTCPAGQEKIYRSGSDQCVTFSGANSVDKLGFIYLTSSSYWLIKDCYIHEAENYTDICVIGGETDGDVSTSSSVPTDQVGINIYSGSSNIEVDSCEIYATGRDTIRITSASNINVHDCDLGGSSAGSATGYFSVAARIGGGSNGVTFTNNKIHDGYQYQGTGTHVRCHAGDWFHIYGNNNGVLESGSDPHNITIERNFLYNNYDFSCANGTAFMFLEDDVYSTTIRNNLFINPFTFMIKTQGVNDLGIYNNTFLNYNMDGTGCTSRTTSPIYIGPNNLSSKIVKIKNNIFYNNSTNTAVPPLYVYSTDVTPTESDYNIFYNTGHSVAVRYGSTSMTLAQWQTQTCGAGTCDAHSYSTNPTFTTLPATGATASSGNYTATGTDVVDKGVSLATIFTTDYNNNERTGTWDIGAIESGMEAGDTTAPTVPVGGAVINTAGTVLTISPSESVVLSAAEQATPSFTLDCDGTTGEGLAYVSGSGTNTLTYNITGRAIEGPPAAETCTLVFDGDADDIQDLSGNDMDDFTGGSALTVTNNSTYSPTAASYTITVTTTEGCAISPDSDTIVATNGTQAFTCTAGDNYQCVQFTGGAGTYCGGTGTTSLTTDAITADCNVHQPCQKRSPDATVGSGCAIKVGSGPAIKVF